MSSDQVNKLLETIQMKINNYNFNNIYDVIECDNLTDSSETKHSKITSLYNNIHRQLFIEYENLIVNSIGNENTIKETFLLETLKNILIENVNKYKNEIEQTQIIFAVNTIIMILNCLITNHPILTIKQKLIKIKTEIENRFTYLTSSNITSFIDNNLSNNNNTSDEDID